MKKNFALSLIFFQTSLFCVSPENVGAAPLPTVSITAPSAILIDQPTSHIIFAKTPYLKRAPASTAKVLTAIVACEHLHLDKLVTIPAAATFVEPSKAYFRPGERYRVRDLIRAALISSANDAALSLAYAAAGSETNFVRLMNQKVQSIGAAQSHFARASGLPAPNQYSTAYDLALIMKEAGRYPFLTNTMKIRECYITSTEGRRILLRNHNKMLWRDPREVIGKTGWTRTAKHCFVGQIRASGKRLFIAMLGSKSLWKDLKRLMDFQFGKFFKKNRKTESAAAIFETRRIQAALKKAGYYKGSITGKFGGRTRCALKKFQKAHGLKATGVPADATLRLLHQMA